MIKDTMKRKKPSFNEAYHGYRTFSELLEDAQREGLLELDVNKQSRTYVVTRFGEEMAAPPAQSAARKGRPRRRAGSKRRAQPAAAPREADPDREGAEAAPAGQAEAPGRAEEPEPVARRSGDRDERSDAEEDYAMPE
jgi:hypothetical protein